MERAVLVVMLVTSLGAVLAAFQQSPRHRSGARAPRRISRSSPLGPRIRQFLWEVMLQGKVIEQRPLPGLAHAFVFWGFLAFALITLNHIAAGFGAAIPVAAMRASAASISASWRCGRSRWRSRSPDCSSAASSCGRSGSGKVVAGIGLHRVPDLHADGDVSGRACGSTRNRCAGRRNWWAAHAGAADLPAADSAHQASAPGAEPGHGLPASAQGFSRIPPLVRRRGFRTRHRQGRDAHRRAAGLLLRRVRPLHGALSRRPTRERCSTRRRSSSACAATCNEFGPATKRRCSASTSREEAAFQCTTCGACEFQCPVGIQHLPMIIGLRRGAVNTGKWEDDYGTKLFLNLERNGNSLGFAAERAAEVHREERAADLRRHAGILPVAGLHGRVRSAGPRDRAGAGARAAARGRHLRRAAEGEVHGRSGAPAGQRPGVHAGGGGEHRNAAGGEGQEDGVDLPALRAHHRHGLAGGRRHLRDRASQRVAGAACRTACRRAAGRAREGGLPRPLLSRPVSRHLRRAAGGDRRSTARWWSRAARASGRSAAARAAARCSSARRRASA